MDDLDQLFKQAAAPVPVPDALMARILADADQAQPRPAVFAARKPDRRGIWSALSDLFGGGGVLAGLASVACAGVYLGAAQPSVISDVTLALSGRLTVEQLDYMPGIDAIFAQE